jgi:hypothetical protein
VLKKFGIGQTAKHFQVLFHCINAAVSLPVRDYWHHDAVVL